MKRMVLVLALLLGTLTLCPFPHHGQDGAYNTASHLAYCTTQAACLHEIGHALDQRSGWISQSAEFHTALQMYLYTELRKPILTELPADILEVTFRGADDVGTVRMEVYAFLFQQAEGQPERMPEPLRQFYNWTLSEHFLQQLHPHQTLYWFH